MYGSDDLLKAPSSALVNEAAWRVPTHGCTRMSQPPTYGPSEMSLSERTAVSTCLSTWRELPRRLDEEYRVCMLSFQQGSEFALCGLRVRATALRKVPLADRR